MPFHAGLDCGGTAHAVCIIDAAGQVVARFTVRHDTADLADLLTRLRHIAPPAELPAAIERPSGLVVDALVEAGHPVIPIHSNIVKACRPRYCAAGGKSDPGDAFMLADTLRTDGHRFLPLVPASDKIKALRALVRGRDDLVAQRVALTNQLRSRLEGFWPDAAAIFADIASLIALAFIARYSTPDSANRLDEKRLASFMASHACCGRRSPVELMARLRAAPAGLAGQVEADVKGEMVRTLTAVLERLVAEIARLSACIEHATTELPDGWIVMSFPRADRLCAAQILAELGDVREHFPTTTSSPPKPASPPSPTPPAGAGASCSAGPATRNGALPSLALLTTPLTLPPGPPPSTARPASAAASTPTPSASSLAPGYASSGALGKTAPPTTLHAMPAPSRRRPNIMQVDTGCLMPP
jgi:hypothetical protein